jgi:hypothetical protein
MADADPRPRQRSHEITKDYEDHEDLLMKFFVAFAVPSRRKMNEGSEAREASPIPLRFLPRSRNVQPAEDGSIGRLPRNAVTVPRRSHRPKTERRSFSGTGRAARQSPQMQVTMRVFALRGGGYGCIVLRRHLACTNSLHDIPILPGAPVRALREHHRKTPKENSQ